MIQSALVQIMAWRLFELIQWNYSQNTKLFIHENVNHIKHVKHVGWKFVPGSHFYIWHCVPKILLWSILCKTVGLPSSTGESERTARRQFHSPTLRCFRGRLCEVAAGRGPLKQSRWPESNWTLPLRSVGVAPSLGRFWLVFTAFKLRYVLRRHIILSDSDGNQGVLDCFTVYPGLGGSAK